MKVVHIIKRIETIDEDIKDLRKLEKSIQKNKSFSTPIYLSIEKQINILLDTRNKYLGLTIANPPADLAREIEGTDIEEKKEKKPVKAKPKSGKSSRSAKRSDIDNMQIVTQDLIDQKFNKLKEEKEREDRKSVTMLKDDDEDDDADDNSIKLLDIALENGTLSGDKEKRKVRFFKDNFPGGEY